MFLISLLRCVIVFILFQNKCRDYILYFKIDNHSFAKISSLCNECPSERGFQPLSRRVECAPTVGFRPVCRKGYINSVKRGKIWPPERSPPCVVKGAEPVMHGSKRGIARTLRCHTGWAFWEGVISKRNFRVRNMGSLSEPDGWESRKGRPTISDGPFGSFLKCRLSRAPGCRGRPAAG